jgi:hypothetical protein
LCPSAVMPIAANRVFNANHAGWMIGPSRDSSHLLERNGFA